MWIKFSIQIAKSLILHSNSIQTPRFGCASCLWCFVLFFFVFFPCTLSTCVHHCTHACGWHRARIFVCSHSVSIINGRKLIQFIAFTYWPESLLQGGIMAAWVCTKTGKKKGESKKEREKERKWKHVRIENTSGRQDGDCSRIETKSSPRLAEFSIKQSRNSWIHIAQKKIGEMGIYRYEYV